LPSDFTENYIKSINAVTIEDIKDVANKYFLADNIEYWLWVKDLK
jgi:predicted Zn-dependent peptidase